MCVQHQKSTRMFKRFPQSGVSQHSCSIFFSLLVTDLYEKNIHVSAIRGKKYNISFYALINVETLQTLQKGTSDVLTSSFQSPLQVWFFLYSCYITLLYSCYSAPETDGTALGLREPFDQLLVGRERKHLHTALWQPVWNASAPSRMVGKGPRQKKIHHYNWY